MIRAFLVALILPIAGGARAGDLTGADIRNELIGQTMSWWETDGWNRGEMRLEPGGAARLVVSAPAPAQDAGRWTLDGDRLCTVWSALREERKCYAVRRVAPGRYLTSGGNMFEIVFAGT
ncbi:MAG: hypothetical protein ACK50Q_01210 [Labrys sp. (in: a-proteobacteria)]